MNQRLDDGENGTLRVLVVEDVADIRDVFALLLKAEGADVVTVANGRDAVDAARRDQFDFVITDLGLPDMPGDIVIREILADAERRPMMIVVTGYGEPYVSRARHAGADVVLTKPVPWSAIARLLRRSGSEVAA
jgi:CheY-like chemotaxis protein